MYVCVCAYLNAKYGFVETLDIYILRLDSKKKEAIQLTLIYKTIV